MAFLIVIIGCLCWSLIVDHFGCQSNHDIDDDNDDVYGDCDGDNDSHDDDFILSGRGKEQNLPASLVEVLSQTSHGPDGFDQQYSDDIIIFDQYLIIIIEMIS